MISNRGLSVSENRDAAGMASEQSMVLRKLEEWINETVTRNALRNDRGTIAALILQNYKRAIQANLDYYLSMARNADGIGEAARASRYKLMAEIYQLLLPAEQKTC